MIALSTSYKEALIAIRIKGKEVYRNLDSTCKHSENILMAIDHMLDSIEESVNENDLYAVVIGPGSFTGVRIGISLVKGLTCGKDNKILPITTFDLMAYSYVKQNNPKEDFVCVINALSGLYYICKYTKDGEKIEDEKIVDESILNAISEIKVGLKEENIMEVNVQPTSKELLELAMLLDKKGLSIKNANQLVPLYLRKSQAEDSLEKIKKLN